jgi:DNA-binding FrmR family transcriptional regulator
VGVRIIDNRTHRHSNPEVGGSIIEQGIEECITRRSCSGGGEESMSQERMESTND